MKARIYYFINRRVLKIREKGIIKTNCMEVINYVEDI